MSIDMECISLVLSLITCFLITVPSSYVIIIAKSQWSLQRESEPLLPLETCISVRSGYLKLNLLFSALMFAASASMLVQNTSQDSMIYMFELKLETFSWFIFFMHSLLLLLPSFATFCYSSPRIHLFTTLKRLFVHITSLCSMVKLCSSIVDGQMDMMDMDKTDWALLIQTVSNCLLVMSEYQVVKLDPVKNSQGRPFSPEKSSSLLSRLWFSWFNPMVSLGNSRILEEKDLWEILETDKSHSVNSKFKKLHLWWRLFLVIKHNLAWQFLYAIFSACLAFAGPFFLNRILLYVESPDLPKATAWLFLVCLFGCSIVKSVSDGQLYFTGRRNGIHVRSILVNEIYGKSLRRIQSNATTAEDDDTTNNASIGKIVTLMSVDAERIREYVSYCHIIIWTPAQIIISVSALVYVLGYPALAGVFIMLCTIPATTLLGKWSASVQECLMKSTDTRVNTMNETLNGIRIIKYFAWEPQFISKILNARNHELRNLIRYYLTEATSGLVWHSCPLLVAFATFFTFTKIAGKELDATTAFTGLALLNALRGPLISFPRELLELFKALVSMKRIEKFFTEQELERYCSSPQKNDEILGRTGDDPNISQDSSYSEEATNPAAGFKNASFSYHSGCSGSSILYNESSYSLDGSNSSLISKKDTVSLIDNQNFILKDLNIEFPPNSLTVICGSTAAGKSSLILALLGEMNRLSGTGFIPEASNANEPSVAYVAQGAWLMHATIRENIMFGERFDEIKYERVIDACALRKDFETLIAGDLTEVGEKGINLSGGQKQRISLARAAYSSAHFVLLDDPLSAVDAPTARHLFDKCINGLMATRTRILVSHAVGLVLPHASKVIVLKSGEMLAYGPVDQVIKDETVESILGKEATQVISKPKKNQKNTDSSDFKLESKSTNCKSTIQKGKLVQEETKQGGSVKMQVYVSYIKAAGGWWFLFAFLTSIIAAFAIQVLNDWWLKEWADSSTSQLSASSVQPLTFVPLSRLANEMSMFYRQIPLKFPIIPTLILSWSSAVSTASYNLSDFLGGMDSTSKYLFIYALIGVLAIIMDTFNFFVQVSGAYKASKTLHAKLLSRVLSAKMRFFDVTPLGRIMNRFSKDIGCIDSDVMLLMAAFVSTLIRGLVVLLVISCITPVFLLIAAPISLLYMWIARLYLSVSREFKRLDSISKSPIYSLFSESLALVFSLFTNGVSTIRAYNAEHRFARLLAERLDKNHRSFFWLWLSNRWLAIRIDFIAAVVVFSAGSSLLLGSVSAGFAGLSLTYALQFTEALLWTVRLHAQMEMNMNSVERVDEYMEIEQEPTQKSLVHLGKEWPSQGAVQVENLCIRYSKEAPDVLHSLSFSCPPSTKIGIVGRTGAGKSSLSLAFFRILPIFAGRIRIDNVDIEQIGLRELRSRLTIIPQDPVLFSGTLRSNLDPFQEYDDALLWSVLRKVHFLDESTLHMTLDAQVCENGNNFSLGQRQLLCMARALLRKSKFVILDEATASVDNETDAKIQAAIRESFQESTVLAVAHRLRTVMDYDRILVLDKGKAVEYDTPLALLSVTDGYFKKMCMETGEYEELVSIARKT